MGDIENLLNESVELITVTYGWNDRGDPTKSKSTASVDARIQEMTGNESIVRSGILSPGDAIGFFATATTLTIGDEVNYNNKSWEITGVFKENETIGSDTIGFQETHLKKIIE